MPSAPDRESTFESLSLPVFSILTAISLVIWWSPLSASLALALHDEQYTHILLILPVSAALIFMDWKPPEPHGGLSVVLGSILLVMAASLTFLIRWNAVALSPDEQLSANMLALVVWWIAAFILCFGLPASRRALFPLCFLFWLIPFPDFALNAIVNLLQQSSAAAAHLLFAAAGVPVEQRGVFVHIPGLTVEVARECSSIRSSSMLIVTTMVLAQLLLRSPWRKVLIILVAFPLSVAKNGLRIFVIAMLTTRVDPSFLTGRVHRKGGIIFFLIALAATFLLLWILRRGEEVSPGVRAKRAVSTQT